MKYVLTFALFSFLSLGLFAQQSSSYDYEVGDQFVLDRSDNQGYDHVKFPPKNFIIKRGGIADMKSLYNTKLTIVAISESGDWVTLKKADGSKFFNRLPTVKAHLPNALKAGELRSANP